jgi:7-keto-8-aminopelargonate synthetase-like enzyme
MGSQAAASDRLERRLPSIYRKVFRAAVDRVDAEKRYRVFVDLERLAGRFPRALWHSPQGAREVVVWCSNDYLGMGQHPDVVSAFQERAAVSGVGAGGTRNMHLERLLRAADWARPKLIVFESVYSMDGDVALSMAATFPASGAVPFPASC